MEIDTQREGDVLIFKPKSRISGLEAKEFQQVLSDGIKDEDLYVVIDFSGVSFISSAGLRAILFAGKGLSQRKGKLALCSFPESIQEIFAISGFNRILSIYDTQESALVGIKE